MTSLCHEPAVYNSNKNVRVYLEEKESISII